MTTNATKSNLIFNIEEYTKVKNEIEELKAKLAEAEDKQIDILNRYGYRNGNSPSSRYYKFLNAIEEVSK